jgi:purine-binding chemotaxis protein CheW
MTTESAGIRVLRCRSGAREWALREELLREVAPAGVAARVPGAPAAVAGVVNIRGQLLTAVDTRHLLGQPATDAPTMVIVVEVGGRRVALAVDEVDDLVVVPMESLEPAEPEAGIPEGAIVAIVRDRRPFLLLDVEALMAPFFGAVAGRT